MSGSALSANHSAQYMSECKRVYAKYIVSEAPFQVNLPDPILKRIDFSFKHEHINASKIIRRSFVVDVPTTNVAPLSTSAAALDDQQQQPLQLQQHQQQEPPEMHESIDVEYVVVTPPSSPPLEPTVSPPVVPTLEVTTIFDPAQKNIFALMETDSFPRFVRSEQYMQLMLFMKKQTHTAEVLREMRII
jgi:hypothetical protein